jgi:hypothetical protein
MRAYSDVDREDDPIALPDIEVFELTASEVAAMDEEAVSEFMARPEFRLAAMNSSVRDKMLDAMVEELNISGGWFYWFCFPGCLPDSEPYGPFESKEDALAEAREGIE